MDTLDFDLPEDAPEPITDPVAVEMAAVRAEIAANEEHLEERRARQGELLAIRILDQGWSWDRAQEEAQVSRPTVARMLKRQREIRATAP